MSDKNEHSETVNGVGATEGREAWVRPELSKIRAGDAEFGATPLVPEGAFGTGS